MDRDVTLFLVKLQIYYKLNSRLLLYTFDFETLFSELYDLFANTIVFIFSCFSFNYYVLIEN